MRKHLVYSFVIFVAALAGQDLLYGQKGKEPDKKGDVSPLALPGHSAHGEIFNEGPRQKAYLMEGMPKIHFPVTSQNPLTQKFVEQGIGQLHGFWYFEAERSFRQAAKLDPECAIAYWGMAMANEENPKRSKGFLKEALKHKSKASKREKLYIEALYDYQNASGPAAGKKTQNIVKAHEAIAKEFPDDLEAQAFLAYYLYKFRGNVKKSHDDVEAVIQEILLKEPGHPVHHYSIHLWDYKTPKKALPSAAKCGQGSPGIAHLWHMPGHIYSDLKRYEDAVWQQEASSRVDHKYMMKNLILPDQIHNYAHNQEWLIRNLIYLGKHKDALVLSKNLIEIPRHPKYNPANGRKSYFYGRFRLFEVLARFELWEETIALANTPYMEPTADAGEQVKRLRQLGIAYVRTGKLKEAQKVLAELESRLSNYKEEKISNSTIKNSSPADKFGTPKKDATHEGHARLLAPPHLLVPLVPIGPIGPIAVKLQPGADKKPAQAKDLATKAKGVPPKRPLPPNLQVVQQAINAINGHWAYMVGDFKEALDLLKKANEDGLVIARMQSLAGDTKGAISAVQGQVKSRVNEVLPLATLVEILWDAGKKKEASDAFKQLRDLSGSIQLGSPVFDRLGSIARELGLPEEWREKSKPAADVGVRPALDTLGPFGWQPTLAPKFLLHDAAGHSVSLDQYKGKPVVLIFYLGYGCLHCTEQLNAFAAKAEQFKKAGIGLVGISTDDHDGLKIALKSCKDGKFAFPLVANPKLDVFKAFRAHDDFEDVPLHATVLIDSMGLIRWLDINYEPFTDVNFVLSEAQRLLAFNDVNCCE